MDPSPSGSGSGRRGKRRSGGRKGNAGGTGGADGQTGARRRKKRSRSRSGNHGNRGQTESKLGVAGAADHSSILGSRVLQKRERQQQQGPPDAFGLFSAYYLGVTADDGYKKPTLDATSRRFGVSPDEVKGLLQEHSLDPETIAKTEFDLEGAKLDVRLAPECMSRTEIARDLYESYLACLNGG